MTTTMPISLLDASCISDPLTAPFASSGKFDPDDVVLRAQTGDVDAFEILYTRHKKRVFSICLRMVRDFSLAEDLMQETFLQLYRNLASFRGASAFTTWLHRMTVNIVLMHLRKRVLPLVSIEEQIANQPDGPIARSFGTHDLSLAGVVDRVTIDRAVAALAPGYRDVFLLHDLNGYQHSDIAAMRDCGLGTSKSQLHKARLALRNALEPQARKAPMERERSAKLQGGGAHLANCENKVARKKVIV